MAKKPLPMEDEEQSRRFLQTARELEAAGKLTPTEGDEAFERAMRKVLPERAPPED